VFTTQVRSEHLPDAADGSGGYVHAESVEHVDGPGTHATGDDHVGAQTVDELRHHAGPVLTEVGIGHDLRPDDRVPVDVREHVEGTASEVGADASVEPRGILRRDSDQSLFGHVFSFP
jgi:hypothetical protein